MSGQKCQLKEANSVLEVCELLSEQKTSSIVLGLEGVLQLLLQCFSCGDAVHHRKVVVTEIELNDAHDSLGFCFVLFFAGNDFPQFFAE
jgi:hypothetical protein